MVFIADPLQFLQQLDTLFQSTKDISSIWITYKRYVPGCERKSQNDERRAMWQEKRKTSGPAHQTAGCLVRATDGKKKKKISTLITSSHDLSEFQMALNKIYMSNMTLRTGPAVSEASSDKQQQQQQQKKHKLQKEWIPIISFEKAQESSIGSIHRLHTLQVPVTKGYLCFRITKGILLYVPRELFALHT